MSCSFKSRPKPEVSWIRFGKEIEEDPVKYEVTFEKNSDTEFKTYLKIIK